MKFSTKRYAIAEKLGLNKRDVILYAMYGNKVDLYFKSTQNKVELKAMTKDNCASLCSKFQSFKKGDIHYPCKGCSLLETEAF